MVFTFDLRLSSRLGLTFCVVGRCGLHVMPLACWVLPVGVVRGSMSCSPCRVCVVLAVPAMTAGCWLG
jgi:hypothetical protein